jgi:Zn finger protein HypA/HybF involved in hydrogenase expression
MNQDTLNKSASSPDACPAPSSENISGEHWRFCLQCGQEVITVKCKLRCPRCHYFMSCSDFDFAC